MDFGDPHVTRTSIALISIIWVHVQGRWLDAIDRRVEILYMVLISSSRPQHLNNSLLWSQVQWIHCINHHAYTVEFICEGDKLDCLELCTISIPTVFHEREAILHKNCNSYNLHGLFLTRFHKKGGMPLGDHGIPIN